MGTAYGRYRESKNNPDPDSPTSGVMNFLVDSSEISLILRPLPLII